MDDLVTLWRPVGPKELDLIPEAGWRAFPPRLAGQPIFYPVCSEDYAVALASGWNAKRDGGGHVTRFSVERRFLDAYEPQLAGGSACREYWIPAEELDAFNEAIVGEIVVTHTFAAE